MARKATNQLLHRAKRLQNDEFYTQRVDIERELQYYGDYFRGKVVYCNCDDPRTSNFFRYFADNFHTLGLSKLIASCYVGQERRENQGDTASRGFYYEYSGGELSLTPDQLCYFDGDGDFRSPECVALLQEADVVVTNPPFSLFRPFVEQLSRYNKQFLIIGNINAITYKEVFALIQENRAWLGVHMGRGISGFIVPEHYELYGTEARVYEDGRRIISPNNCLWLTNLPTPQRNNPLALTKTYQGNEELYPRYDNYDGINVSKTVDIPMDYVGAMGVPITFLHKFNPHQFEIIQFRKGIDGVDLSVNGKCPYFRILIRNKMLAQ